MNTNTELLRKLVELLEQYHDRKVNAGRVINQMERSAPALSRLLEAGVPEGYALVPKDQKLIPHAAWDNAAVAFRAANGSHGFYESCYAAFHAFLRSIGQEKPRKNFKELREKMTPESQARATALTDKMLKEMVQSNPTPEVYEKAIKDVMAIVAEMKVSHAGYWADYLLGRLALMANHPPSEGEQRNTCHASRGDGECGWSECPQLRDGEPMKSGRHCPLDIYEDDE